MPKKGETKKRIQYNPKNGQVYVNDNLIRNRPDYDARDDLFRGIEEYFALGKISGNSHLSNILEKVFKKAESNIDKSSTMALQTAKMFSDLAKDTNDYFASKRDIDSDFIEFQIDKKLLEWQRTVMRCTAKHIQLLAGRRAGKSFFLCMKAIAHCTKGYDIVSDVKKPRDVVILGLTLSKCADIYWEMLKETIELVQIPTAHIDNSKYEIKFSNGASIKLWGTSTKAEINKLRGLEFSLMIIDECQSIKNLHDLIVNILEPIRKARGGTIILAGTGPLYAGTYYEQICTSDTWEHFHATMQDNKTVDDYEHALEEVLIENNWTMDNPTFVREYLGQIAYDSELLVVPKRTYYTDDEFTEKDYKIYNKCMIGIDHGFTDNEAFAVILYNDNGDMILAEEFVKNHMSVTDIINKGKDLVNIVMKKYNIARENIKAVADNSNGNVNRELFMNGMDFLQDAYKCDLLYQINRLQEMCSCGYLKIKKGGFFDKECDRTVWKKNENEKIVYEIDDGVYHPDQLHAVRYAVNTILYYNSIIRK